MAVMVIFMMVSGHWRMFTAIMVVYGSLRGICMWIMMLLMVMMVFKLDVVRAAAMMRFDLLGVVVEDTNAIETQNANDEKIDANEDPDEVASELGATVPTFKHS